MVTRITIWKKVQISCREFGIDRFLEFELSFVYKRILVGYGLIEYSAPTSLKDALELLSNRRLQVVAGGTDYFPSRGNQRSDLDLLDITRVDALKGIEVHDDYFRIGATTSWTDVLQADLPSSFDGLKAAAKEVGSVQIQNAGTLAGNLSNASPAADGVPPLLTLEAEVELSSMSAVRRVPLQDFITGVRSTSIAPNELITSIRLPKLPDHVRSGFEKLGSRRYLVISISMVAAAIGCDKQGRIDFARLAVGSCSPVAQRLLELERDLIGQMPDRIELEERHFEALSPIDDVRGSAVYRKHAVSEQIRRVVKNVTSHG